MSTVSLMPVVALIGRPNVGKSTLFNRLTGSRGALVADYSGLTRDRQYGEANYGDHPFIVIDTGGLVEGAQGIEEEAIRQTKLAMIEADIIIFIVEAQSGLTAADEVIVQHLRTFSKPIILAVNKTEGFDTDVALSDFYVLGFSQVVAIAAEHNRGINALLDVVFQDTVFPELPSETELTSEDKRIQLAIVGRPNVGKSTLVNLILGEERVVVFDEPGTTRDSIFIPCERDGIFYTLVDTAGVRRRGKISLVAEKFSVVKTLQAIRLSQVVVMLLDATEGVVDQDVSIIQYILTSGRSMVIGINKWDGLTVDQKQLFENTLDRKLNFLHFVKFHKISARHGTGVGEMLRSVSVAYRTAHFNISSNELTEMLQQALATHQPPLVQGRRIKLRYAHMGGQNPPVIVIHGNQTNEVPESYKKFLDNYFHKRLNLQGTPLQIEFRTGKNPFEGKKNTLSDRQKRKRSRLRKKK